MNMALQVFKESKHAAIRCRLSPPASPSRRAGSSNAASGPTASKPRSRILAALDEMDLDYYANLYYPDAGSSSAQPQPKETSRAAENAPVRRGASANAGAVRSASSKPCVLAPVLSMIVLLA
jgi:hypothetical protein